MAADAGQFYTVAGAVRAEATDVGALSPTVVIGANDQTGGVFGAVRAEAAAVGALNPTLTVSGDASPLERVFSDARRGAESLAATTRPTLTVSGDASPLERVFSSVRTGAASLVASVRPTITISGDSGPWDRVASVVRGGAASLGALRPSITITGDSGPWDRVRNLAATGAAALGRLRPTIAISGDSGPFSRAATAVTAGAAALGRLRPTVTADANTRPAISGFSIVTAAAVALGRLRPTVTVDVDAASATAKLIAFGALAVGTMTAIKTAVSTLSGPVGIGLLIGAIGLAAGAIGPLAGSVTILGAAAAGLAGGLGLVAGAAYTLANSSSPAVQAALSGLKTSFDQLKQSMFRAFEPSALELATLGQTAITVANNQLPLLGPAATSTVASMHTAFQGVIDQVGASSSNSLSTILGYIPGLMGGMTTAAGSFGAGFLSVMGQAMPYAQTFMDKVVSVANNFFRWSESDAGRQQIKDFLDAAVPVAQALWQAFTDIVPRLVDIGITYGPTVATTISDISRFVGLLLDALGYIQPALDTFVRVLGDLGTAIDTTSLASGKSTEEIRGSWAKLGEDLGITGPIIKSALLGPFEGAYDALVGNSIVPDTVNQTESWFSGLPDKIQTGLSSLPDKASGVFSSAWSSISSTTSPWTGSLQTLGTNMISGLLTNIGAGDVSGTFGTIGSTVSSSTSGWPGEQSSLGTSMISSLLGAISGGDVGGTFSGIWSSITTTVSSWASNLYNTGVAMIQGLINGISANAQAVYDTMSNIATSALDGAKKALGIASPSRELRAVGQFAGEGLVEGASSQLESVGRAGTEMGVRLVGAAKQSMSALDALQAELEQTGDAMVGGLVAGAERARQRLVASFQEIARAALDAARATLRVQSPSQEMASVGEFAGEGLVEGLRAKQEAIVSQSQAAATAIKDTAQAGVAALDDLRVTAAAAGRGIMDSLISGVEGAKDPMQAGLHELVSAAVANLNTLRASALEAGHALVDGLAAGVENARDRIVSAMRDIAVAAMEAARAELQVRSPSQKMMEIGEFAGQGFAEGLRRQVDPTRAAAEELARAAMPGFATDRFERAFDGSIPGVAVWRAGHAGPQGAEGPVPPAPRVATPAVRPSVVSGGSSPPGGAEGDNVEAALALLGDRIEGALKRVGIDDDSARRIGAGVKGGVDRALENDPATRKAVEGGLDGGVRVRRVEGRWPS